MSWPLHVIAEGGRSEGVLRPVSKVAITHARIRAQSVSSLVALVRPGAGGTYSSERSQSRTRVAYLAEAER